MLCLGFHHLKTCPTCGSVSMDEETTCGVCGTSFLKVQDTTDKGLLEANGSLPARWVVNRDTLRKLGAWSAILASGLGLILLTLTNAPLTESRYYYRYGAGLPWAGVLTLGLVLVVLAMTWASLWLYPGKGRRRISKRES